MCVGVPMLVVDTADLWARCEGEGRVELVDLALVGPQPVGQWLLVHLGAAREALTPEAAALIARALEGLRGAMAGTGVGDAFADIEARAPSLPPHLEAARLAGRDFA
jgi:hydrogenase expression/formation protein HypC